MCQNLSCLRKLVSFLSCGCHLVVRLHITVTTILFLSSLPLSSRWYRHVQCNICRCPMPFPHCYPVILSSCFTLHLTCLTTRPTSPHPDSSCLSRHNSRVRYVISFTGNDLYRCVQYMQWLISGFIKTLNSVSASQTQVCYLPKVAVAVCYTKGRIQEMLLKLDQYICLICPSVLFSYRWEVIE